MPPPGCLVYIYIMHYLHKLVNKGGHNSRAGVGVADEIPLRLRLALLRFVTLSAVEIRAKRGSNDAKHHLGSEAQKFDSLRSLRMTVGDTPTYARGVRTGAGLYTPLLYITTKTGEL